MRNGNHNVFLGLIEAAESIAFGVWFVAAVCIPVALLVRSYSVALLLALLVVFWQVIAALLGGATSSGTSRTRLRFRYRPTAWGGVYCAIALLFCIVSVHWGINLLYMTAAFLLGGVVCTAMFPRLMLRRTATEWGLPPHVFAGEPFSVELTLRNDKKMLSAFGLWVGVDGGSGLLHSGHHHIPRLTPGRPHRVLLRQYLPERGLQRLRPVTVVTAFPFGLMEATMEAQLEEDVLALPRIGRIHQEVLRRHKGGEARWLLDLRRKDEQGEFRSLREYQPGDNPRHIHWPTSARLRRLFVREFERREMHSLLLLLDSSLSVEHGEHADGRVDRYEKAVRFAATMAALLNERNVFYAFASYCPNLVALPYDVGPGHLFSVLEALALAEPSSGRTVADLVDALSFQQVSGGGVCLITPGPLSGLERAASLGPLYPDSVTIDVSEPEFDEIFSP
ncbi:MAG: DUF58 domain-containing protein [Planctomycetota bacterium]|jgi:uncharacterized protein (DUF58 family)